jgi:phosphohistidine phosphatase
MPIIYLMRHGQAEIQASSDTDRQLTSYGKDYSTQIAKQFCDILIKYQYPVPTLLHSGYLRAVETAKIIEKAVVSSLGNSTGSTDSTDRENDLISERTELITATPDYLPQACFDSLGVYSRHSFMLVSHMPLVASLASLMEHGNVFQSHPFQTSEIRVYEVDQWIPGGAEFKFRLL